MDILTRFAIDKSRLTLLVMIGVLFLGVSAYNSVPKRENPAITVRTAVVTAVYPGMAPDRMEELIAIPIERAMREIGEVEGISTRIVPGVVTLNVAIGDGIPSNQIDRIFQDIRNKADAVASDLPDGTFGPLVNTEYGNVAIATVAVTGDGFTPAEVTAAADDLRDALSTIEGVTRVSLFGDQEERIWLDVDPRALAAIGAQLPEVISDLRNQNVILPAGQINAGDTNILLEANGDLGSVNDIAGVLTQVRDGGSLIRLGDLMNVRRGYVDPQERPVFFNGKPAVVVAVEMAPDRDIQELGGAIEDIVRLQEHRQPIGISFQFSSFQETNVTQAINGAIVSVLQTFIVVLLAMVVFMGLKSAVIISAIVPFSVAFALYCLSYFGIALEQVSIAAVIISLGLLVDNGLVVVEDIQRRINEGTAPKEAAIEAGGQFFLPLAVASITTVSAFIPILILEGVEGEFAFSLGAVAGLVLAGSFLTAHYILPYLCSIFLKPQHGAEPDEPGAITRYFGAGLRRILPYGFIVMAVSYGLVLLSSGVFQTLKSEMFPLSERADYLVYLELPRGSTLAATTEEALRFEEWLRDPESNPDTANTTLYVGDGGPRFYLALNPADADPSSAFILVNTNDYEEAISAVDRARRELIENYPAVRGRVTRLSMGGAESGIVEVRITGPDADVMLDAAAQVEAAFAEVPGITLNQSNWGNRAVTFVLDIAQDRARDLGVSSQDISNVLQTYFSGTEVSTFRDDEDQIPIVLRAAEPFRGSIEDLARVSIPTGTGLIALDQVATLQPTAELSRIRRNNQVRQIIIEGQSAILSAAEIEQIIQPTIDALNLGSDHEVVIGGETERSAETNANLGAGVPLALAVMLTALMLQFNSIRRVALTFLTIPLILIGAPLALWMTGQPLSFFAILGLISLMGIIINNAIVLVNQIDIERAHLGIEEAIVAASMKRVRPILLTSLTTILGLLPLAMAGGALFEPMATLMIGGLLISSPLSLIVVPCVYLLMFRSRQRSLETVCEAPSGAEMQKT